MRYFSLPADFQKATLDRYAELNAANPDSQIATTYGNITIGNLFGSGRDVKRLPETDFTRLAEYVDYSQQKQIPFSYTLNASFLQNVEFTREGVHRIREFLGRLHELGIRNLIVAIPSLIEVIRALPWEFDIKASVICQVTNPNKAMALKRMGVDSLVIDESIVRNFALLASIRKAFGERVEIIVNSICHQDCQYRMFHYNQISGDSISEANPVSTSYYTSKCVMRLYEDLSNFLKLCWVRPEDLQCYEAIGINHFKIQGRQAVLQGSPVRAVETYMRGHFEGNLNELLLLFSPFPYIFSIENRKLDGFVKLLFEGKRECTRDCEKCRYCQEFAKRIFDMDRDPGRAQNELGKIKANLPLRQLVNDENKA